MKICIPTADERGLDSPVSEHFGSAPFFTLVELEGGTPEVVANPSCHQRPHGCHHVGQLTSRDVRVLVCHGVGRNALASLLESGIEVLVSRGVTVAEVLEEVGSGKTRPLGAEEACGGGRHRHGQSGRGRGRGATPRPS